MENDIKDKIEGMFLGLYLGDALGMPVETFTPSQIKEKYGKVEKCLEPKGHKWWDGHAAGTYTDDTQLSLAVAQALIDAKNFSMDEMVKQHIKALNNKVGGWGRSTTQAVKDLRKGKHWTETAVGEWDTYGPGVGNGIPMKISPLAAYFACKFYFDEGWEKETESITKLIQEGMQAVADISNMTHGTRLSFASGLSQFWAVSYCILTPIEDFDYEAFKGHVLNGPRLAVCHELERAINDAFATQNETQTAIVQIGGHDKQRFDCLHSLPLTYYSFSQDPMSFESVLFAVNAGGDTDTNASMVGAILGALHGKSIFPKNVIDTTLTEAKDEVMTVAKKFCDTFAKSE